MKCPICEKESKDNICLNCGYDLENDLMNNKLLSHLNKEEIDKYNQQINIQKKLYKELIQLRENKPIKTERIYTKEEQAQAYQYYKQAMDYFNNKDYINAEKYFIKGDELGDKYCPFYLALLYRYTDTSHYTGITKDLSKALYYYQRSAERGFSTAYRCIGDMILTGEGTKMNLEKGLKMYNKALELHDSYALKDLADYYRYGKGCVKPDYKKAFEMYKQDIEKYNRATSYRRLAEMYEQGLGVSKDLKKAEEYRDIYEMIVGNQLL